MDLSLLLNKILVATLNPATMELLSLFRGDTVICRYVWPDLQLLQFANESGV